MRYPVLLLSLPLGATFWQAWNRPPPGQHERWYGELELLLVGLAAALVAGFGTNNGLLKVPYGLWLALPAAFLVMLERIGSEGHRSVWLLCGIVVILGTALRMAAPYRDYPDRRRLLTPVAHPRLTGIHTTATQARRVEGLMAELAKYAREGDTVLAVG